MRVLLDTNAFAALKRGNVPVAELVRGSEEVLMSTIVVGELLYGFQHGARFAQNVRDLNAFLENPFVTLVDVTRVTADRFGRVASALRKKGKPLPTNDVWIAAHALETGADLVSFDHHFEHVDGLVWVCPTQ